MRTRPAGKRLPGLREAGRETLGSTFRVARRWSPGCQNRTSAFVIISRCLIKSQPRWFDTPLDPPGRSKRAAAAAVARRRAATNEACGRADPTTSARSMAGRGDRARAAWGWLCRVAGPAGCRSFPWRSAHARRAREAKRDQDQVLEIPGFRVWETADNRTAKADRQRFPASAGLRANKTCIDVFMIRSHQGPKATRWPPSARESGRNVG